jgi:hypothetical protein
MSTAITIALKSCRAMGNLARLPMACGSVALRWCRVSPVIPVGVLVTKRGEPTEFQH